MNRESAQLSTTSRCDIYHYEKWFANTFKMLNLNDSYILGLNDMDKMSYLDIHARYLDIDLEWPLD